MLDGHVLVLNRVFQAVQITSVRRALTLLYKGQVRAVDSEYRTYDFENWMDIPAEPEHPHPARRAAPRVRSAAAPGSEVLAREHLSPRQQPLPVLREEVPFVRAVARSRRADLARRKVDLGERRLRLPAVQRAQGQQAAARVRHAPHPPAPPPEVAPAASGEDVSGDLEELFG